MNTAYFADSMLEDAVFTSGVLYVQGEAGQFFALSFEIFHNPRKVFRHLTIPYNYFFISSVNLIVSTR